MKVTVKLYGTLAAHFPDYDPEKGLQVELPAGAQVGDLTAQLKIAPADAGVVAMDGRVAQPDAPLRQGAQIRIFPLAHGG